MLSQYAEPGSSAKTINAHFKSAQEYRILRATVALGPLGWTPVRKIYCGSGVLAKRKGKTVLITARHFFDDVRPEKAGILFPQATQQVFDKPIVVVPEGQKGPKARLGAAPVQLEYESIFYSDKVTDIAIVTLKNPLPRECDACDLDYKRLPATPKEDDLVLLAGFPISLSVPFKGEIPKSVAFGRYGAILSTYVKDETDPGQWNLDGVGSFKKRKHFAAYYDPDTYKTLPPDPVGFSGGGVWSLSTEPPKGKTLISPAATLVGIQVGHLKPARSIKVVRIKEVIRILDEALGGAQ